MSSKAFFLVFLSSILVSCTILIHPAYADTFNDYQSATFLAKISEVKVETSLIATHAGNKDALNYYENLLNKYWTLNDTRELALRNPQLAGLISAAINDTISEAQDDNGDKAYSDYFDIAGYMEQAGVVRVDPTPLNNATIQAMAISMVLRESLERYGDAINSPQLANISPDMSNAVQSNSAIPTGKQKIVNEFAYENSKELSDEASQMFDQFITHNYNGVYNDKISSFMTKYVSDLGSAADPNTLVSDVVTGIYPNFVTGYGMNLESIPEFPIPLLAVVAMISAAIAITRFDLKKVFP
ncbi:MAG: hypothetical protein KGI25_05400 [Thaumarchaeota archaeon]|nr:hypothetical protein [Nitrososphaerota archaeon]